MKRLLVIVTAAFCLVACSTSQSIRQRSIHDQQAFAQIKDSINQKTFTATFDYVIPRRMKAHYLTTEYNIRINKDTIQSFLPFFGIAYQSDMIYSHKSPLQFCGSIEDYHAQQVKKDKIRIDLKTRNNMDRIAYQMEVFNNGHVTLTVIPTQRESITFTGNIKLSHD